MALKETLARPYARAIFRNALAQKHKGLQAWTSVLATLAGMCAQAKVSLLLHSPALTPQQKVDNLIELAGNTLNDAAHNLLRVLADNKRLPLLPDIGVAFAALKAAHEKTLAIQVSTSFAMDAAEQQAISDTLQKHFKRKAVLTVVTDATLIGGLVIRAGNTVIDVSLRGRLNQLSKSMQAVA